jgi:hypothetical protein
MTKGCRTDCSSSVQFQLMENISISFSFTLTPHIMLKRNTDNKSRAHLLQSKLSVFPIKLFLPPPPLPLPAHQRKLIKIISFIGLSDFLISPILHFSKKLLPTSYDKCTLTNGTLICTPRIKFDFTLLTFAY